MKKLIKKLVRAKGYQITRFPDPDLVRRLKMMKHCGIDTIYDVGANNGFYALNMREIGYKGRIISFEPLRSAFDVLKQNAANDSNWSVHNYAIGEEDGTSFINVAGNSYSSSILDMLPAHLSSAPESRYIGREEIQIKKLDNIFGSFSKPGDRVMLKIDTQGYEKNVLDGALRVLPDISLIQLEMSIVPLYEKEMLYMDMIAYLDKLGFILFSLENGFSDENTGQLFQVDGIFMRKQ